MSPAYPTVAAALAARAGETPDALAFRYLLQGDVAGPRLEWTYRDLHLQARRIAAALGTHCAPGDRVLLLYPPGLDFVAALFACFQGGRVAVPAYPPDPRQLGRSLQRLAAMVADAEVRVVLADSLVATLLEALAAEVPQLTGVSILATDRLPEPSAAEPEPAAIDPEAMAYLQYTSGSTGQPRGVAIRHRNVIANLEASAHMRLGPGCRAVGWVPVYHDLGLISFVLSPVYLGFECTLFSPLDFLRRPARWVEALSQLRATHTAGPTFGYDLVVRKTSREQVRALDLSPLLVAGVGAEPVHGETLERFIAAFAPAGLRSEAVQPTYGLAECVLYAAFKQDLGARYTDLRVQAAALAQGRVAPADGTPGARTLVSCGQVVPGHELRIVDPDSLQPCPEATVGEIWLAGPSVADGYWHDVPDSATTYGVRLAAVPGRAYLRTGDLGFLRNGEVFIVGRRKDLIIIGGRNLYPQDLERTAEEAHPGLRPGCVAAFAVEANGSEAVVIVAEARPGVSPQELEAAMAAIREAVAEAHEVAILRVVLLRAETIPKTSSGKLRRHATRQQLEAGGLEALASWTRPAEHSIDAQEGIKAGDPAPASAEALSLQEFLCNWLARELKLPSIDPARPLAEYGLDSVVAVALARELEARTGLRLPAAVAWSYPTVAGLARHLAERAPAEPPAPLRPAPPREHYPLSFTELGLFRLLERQPVQHAYNLFFPLQLSGEIDAAALEASFLSSLVRHDNLRTAFTVEDGQSTRRILPQVDWRLAVADLSALPSDAKDAAITAACERIRHRTFDLARPPLFAAELLQLSPTKAILLLSVSHMAMDAFSAGILLRDLGTAYEAARRGESVTLPPLPIRCADYAVYCEERFREVLARGREAFAPYPEDGYRLPLDHALPAIPSIVGARHPFLIPEALCTRLEGLAQSSGVPLSTVMLCAFQVMLHRHARSPRVSFTVVRGNRQLPGLEELVGYLVYGETMHSQLGGVDYHALLHRGQEFLKEERQEAQPYNFLVQPPSMRVLFNYYSRPLPVSFGGLALQFRPDLDRFAYLWDVHDLMLRVLPAPRMMLCELAYRSEILESSTIRWMAEQLTAVLEEMLTAPADEVRWAAP